MATWGNKRKYTIGGVFLIIILFVGAYVGYQLFNSAPSCTDRKQNQKEQGVDCGGPCDLFCKGTAAEPVVLWARAFKVTYGVYTAAISIQNPNLNAAALDVPYRMRILDADGVTVFERYGKADINPKYTFPIIEPGIYLGERTPSRIVFEFLEEPRWYKRPEKMTPVSVRSETVYNEASAPRIEARIENDTVKDVTSVKVGVIVYGSSGNAIAVSRTLIDRVPGSGYANAVFTWPEPFTEPILRKEIIVLE